MLTMPDTWPKLLILLGGLLGVPVALGCGAALIEHFASPEIATAISARDMSSREKLEAICNDPAATPAARELACGY